MKRLRHTALHLAVIGLVLAVAFYYSALYFTPEQVMAANERGLHYGPSRQILLEYDGPENTRLLIGKVDDRTLSVIPTQRAWMVFWKLRSGGVTGRLSIELDIPIVADYERAFQLYCGIVDCPGAASIQITLPGYDDETGETLEPWIFMLPVDENGFFYLENAPDEGDYQTRPYCTVYDTDGNILYSLQP